MKTLKRILALVMLAFVFASCEDDSVKATLKSDVEPNELLAPTSAAYVLTLDKKDNVLETFKWTAANFGFTASVTYKLQIDKAGSNFSKAAVIATTTSLEAEVKVGVVNDILLSLGFVPEEATDLEIRVVASVNEKIGAVTSNVRTVKATSYATSFPPIYGMGDGLKGWGPWPDNAVEWQSSAFKKYETVTYFTNGKAFRFFAQTDWNPTSYNYPYFTTVDALFSNANDGDKNFKIAGASGWYKVSVDLGAKTVTALAVAEPVLYMMGDAINGWGPWNSKEVKMTFLKPGVFSVQSTFAITGAFRFFAQNDWGPTSYNYPYFTSVASDFANANDGDKNFKYVGTAGSRKVTVDLNEKKVTLGDPPVPVLYMTGAALNGWGWAPGQYISMTYKGSNTFEATATFTNNETFRFFAQTDWSPTSYNYPYFTSVASDFVNAADGDSNLRYVGTTGSRTITVNMTTKAVTLN